MTNEWLKSLRDISDAPKDGTEILIVAVSGSDGDRISYTGLCSWRTLRRSETPSRSGHGITWDSTFWMRPDDYRVAGVPIGWLYPSEMSSMDSIEEGE